MIVEAAESSPSAAKEAANIIRGYLRENNNQNAHAQYNAIMLIRILTDHPGPAFTTYLNDKFAKTVKELLRSSWDPSVQQLLRETLDNFARDKSNDPSLRTLNDMWLKEKTKTVAPSGMPTVSHHRSYIQRNYI